MKNPYLLSVATAVVGFAVAWTLKPDAATAPTATATAPETASPVARSPRTTAGPRSGASTNRQPKEVSASDFPLADQAERGPKSRDEARMLRLTEALGLSIEQQGGILSLIENTQNSADGSVPVLEDLTTRGKAIEEGLASLLTPEQREKFEELRVRERDNLIEVRAQKLLTDAIAEIDLSPEQRDEVLARLRQKAKADMQAIPAAASLLFEKSILPTNQRELSVDGVLLLAKVGEETMADTAAEGYEIVRRNQRGELEEILRCFDGVLTPGQMGQYQAALAETKTAMENVPSRVLPPGLDPEPAPVSPPETIEILRESLEHESDFIDSDE